MKTMTTRRRLERARFLAWYGVGTLRHEVVLYSLAECDGIRSAQLAKIVGIEVNSMKRAVQGLEKSGLVRVEVIGKARGSRVRFFLEEKARQLLRWLPLVEERGLKEWEVEVCESRNEKG